MPMSEGQLKSLAAVARKLREQEAPLRERQDPAGLGIGAAALLVEMAGEELARLRATVRDCWPFLFEDDGSPRAPEELRQRIKDLGLSETSE